MGDYPRGQVYGRCSLLGCSPVTEEIIPEGKAAVGVVCLIVDL